MQRRFDDLAGAAMLYGGQKWSAANMADQSGRVAVITGANTGLGFQIAAALAGRGAHVVLAVRDLAKGKAAAARITDRSSGADVAVQRLDLTSLTSIRAAADAIKRTHGGIDLLINNAGVSLTPPGRTGDGFELQVGTNHLGHFALTGLLLDRLMAVHGSRIVTISSLIHRAMDTIDFDDLYLQPGHEPGAAYARSKLANLLFTYELQRRLEAASAPTIAVAAHPGVSNTGLWRHARLPVRMGFTLISQSPRMGALPILRAATDQNVCGGQYFGPRRLMELRGHPRVVRSSAQSHDEEQQRKLWKFSEELTGVSYPV